jgi:hypothetical protein
MGGVASDLVPQTLAGNDSDLIANPLVDLEVKAELGVVTAHPLVKMACRGVHRCCVPLNDDLGGLLDGLRPDATHDCGVGLRFERGGVENGVVELADVVDGKSTEVGAANFRSLVWAALPEAASRNKLAYLDPP